MNDFDPRSITRPDEAYLSYILVCAALTLFGFPFVVIPLYIRYRTLRYRIDDEGLSMSVGWLWKRETYIAYRRIQDIHVTRNLLHRWLGLSRIDVLTASGHAGAEMTIEGVRSPDALRDFLYTKMRGARGEAAPGAGSRAPGVWASDATRDDLSGEALSLLHDIRDELRAIRESAGGGSGGDAGADSEGGGRR